MKKLYAFSLELMILFLSCNNTSKSPGTEVVSDVITNKYEIKIDGMSCTGCEQTIQNCVSGFEGISKVTASHEKGNAIIESTKELSDTVIEGITSKINETGYTVVSLLPVNKNENLE